MKKVKRVLFWILMSLLIAIAVIVIISLISWLTDENRSNGKKGQTKEYTLSNGFSKTQDTTFVKVLTWEYQNLGMPEKCNWKFDPIVTGSIQFIMKNGEETPVYRRGDSNVPVGKEIPKAVCGEGVFLFTVTTKN